MLLQQNSNPNSKRQCLILFENPKNRHNRQSTQLVCTQSTILIFFLRALQYHSLSVLQYMVLTNQRFAKIQDFKCQLNLVCWLKEQKEKCLPHFVHGSFGHMYRRGTFYRSQIDSLANVIAIEQFLVALLLVDYST